MGRVWVHLAALFIVGPMAGSGAAANLYTLDGNGRPQDAEVQFIEGVPDALFSLLVGLVEANTYGSLDRGELEALIEGHGTTRLPLDDFRWLQRSPTAEGSAIVRVLFERRVDLDLPYSLLGYHPGALQASPELLFREYDLRTHSLWIPGADGGRRIELENCHLWMLERGELSLDVDAWLDRLFGSKLDDVSVTGVMTFTYEGVRYGLGFGYNNKEKGRTGVFNLEADDMIFPAPRVFLQIGRMMRAEGEALLKARTTLRTN